MSTRKKILAELTKARDALEEARVLALLETGGDRSLGLLLTSVKDLVGTIRADVMTRKDK